jgi:hypothetical protein
MPAIELNTSEPSPSRRRLLRVGIIHDKRIVEERLVSGTSAITIGNAISDKLIEAIAEIFGADVAQVEEALRGNARPILAAICLMLIIYRVLDWQLRTSLYAENPSAPSNFSTRHCFVSP